MPPCSATASLSVPWSRWASDFVRAVLQRVRSAAVSVDGVIVGEITRPGLLALVAATHGDGPVEAERMVRKIAQLRILHDERSVLDESAPVLVVSQFSLYGDTRKGRRPSWSAAAPGPVAEPLVDAVVAGLRSLGVEVATGVFGAMMAVSLVNDGPLTLLVET
jgi:D-tyrosyl-tRNA(Tyr) deacylase